MIDTKIRTLLTLVNVGNYTKTAKILSLTQPAVSNHIKLLEQEYKIKIFIDNKKDLTPTPEGEILIDYAKKVSALSNSVVQAIEDSYKDVKRVSVGMTNSLAEFIVTKMIAPYCQLHPSVHINIITDTVKNLYSRLRNYEIEWAIVEGNIKSDNFTSVLLDTDYLCLLVAPTHKIAGRKSITLEELKKEKLVLRSPNAGTRSLFENHLLSMGENISDFNIVLEIDNINTIKELVASNVGVTIMSYSVSKKEVTEGKLVVVAIENLTMFRQIKIVYNKNLKNLEMIQDLKAIYDKAQ